MRAALRSLMCLLAVGCSESPAPSHGTPADPGPRSGLSEDTALTALDGAGREALCTWWGNTLGNGRTQHCEQCTGNACTDYDVAVSTQADCVKWLQTLSCDLTVRDAEDCAFAQKPDLCASPAACEALLGC